MGLNVTVFLIWVSEIADYSALEAIVFLSPSESSFSSYFSTAEIKWVGVLDLGVGEGRAQTGNTSYLT